MNLKTTTLMKTRQAHKVICSTVPFVWNVLNKTQSRWVAARAQGVGSGWKGMEGQKCSGTTQRWWPQSTTNQLNASEPSTSTLKCLFMLREFHLSNFFTPPPPPHPPAPAITFFYRESYCVAQAGLKLLCSRNSPASASQVLKCVPPHQLIFFF
jgi:hypothetical protein